MATSPQKHKKHPVWEATSPFILGGLSGMAATAVIQPIDMIKVRIQLHGEGAKGVKANPITLARQVIAHDGFMSLYTGLSAGLLRQATYTTARMGIYREVSDLLHGDKKQPLSFTKKTIAGLAAGGFGAVFGTPADVALIRMQADKTMDAAHRRNYKGVVDALTRITREEGLKGLFAGNTPVVVRAMALNVGMLATYDQALESLKPFISNDGARSVAAKFISGFFASFFSLPFDFIKTRMQKQKPGPDGHLPYRSTLHCAARVLKEEGALSFYRGFWTYYIRIAPHAMITLAALDVLNSLTKNW